MSSLAFVACVERGELEKKTLLLCRSIRRFAGRHADSPIYTFQPRRGTTISRDTAAELAYLGVQHSTELLNERFGHYAIGNKIFASARAEEISREDVVVFLDSDSVIVNEPLALELSDGIDAAVRPVDMHRSPREPESDDDPFWQTRFRRVSSSGAGDPNEDYWLRLYDMLGIAHRPFLETTCSQQRIRAYFNSGLIAVRRSAGLFAQWREDFVQLMDAKHVPHGGPLHYMDQVSLAATLTRVWDRVTIPDGRYNYPLPGRDSLVEPYRGMSLDAVIHLHYNKMFDFVSRWLEPPHEELACS